MVLSFSTWLNGNLSAGNDSKMYSRKKELSTVRTVCIHCYIWYMFSKVYTSRDGVSTTSLSNLWQGHREFLPNIESKSTLFAFKHANVGLFGLSPLLWRMLWQHGAHTCWEQGTPVSLHCRKMGILVPAPVLADTFLSSHSFSPRSNHCVWQYL